MAGYYDSPPENMKKWLDAAQGHPEILGTIYTTWENNYRDLEAFEKIVDGYRK